MGFSLSNLLKQGTAQVNPFDHGQTAATVKKQQQQPVVAKLPAPGQIHAAPQMAPVAQHVMAPVMPHQNPLIHAFGNVDHAFNNVAHAGGNVVNSLSTHSLNNVANSNFNPTHLVEQYAVKPGMELGAGIGANIYNHAVAPVFNLPKQQLTNAFSQSQEAQRIAHLGVKQQAANALNVASNALPGGGKVVDALATKAGGAILGKVGENVAGRVLAKGAQVGTKVAGNSAIGGGMGYGLGASNTLLNGGSLSQANQAGLANAKIGAVLGGGGTALAEAAPHVIQGAKTTTAMAKNYGLKPPTNLTLSELAASNKVINGNPMDLTNQDAQLFHQAQSKLVSPDLVGTAHGMNAASDALNAHTAYNTAVQQRAAALQDFKSRFTKTAPLGQAGSVSEDSPLMPLNKPIANAADKLLGKGKQAAPSPAAVSKKTGSSAGSIAPTAATATKPTLPAKPAATAAPRKPGLLTSGEGSGASTPKPKTGVVDKQLNEVQKAQRQVINYAADELRNNSAGRDIHSEIRQAGGISKSDYEDIPANLKNKNGQSMDDLATQLGFKSDAELYDAIHSNQKAMTITEAKAEAQKQLESGKHPYSADYKQITDAIKKRQDELTQYPKGTYRRVKVTNKPSPMSDAELQSLAGTPEGAAKKVGNKVVETNPKTTLRNTDAERKVQDVLAKGGSSEEAIGTYMHETGTDLQTAVHDVKRVAQESNLGFDGGKNPLEGKVPLGGHVAEGDSGQAFLNADFIRQHEQAIGKDALKAFNGLSDHDKTLLQDIEKDTVANVAERANNPQAFTDAEKAIRTYYDTRHAYDTALGIDVGYRQNYLRQLFAKAEEEANAAMPEQTTLQAGNKRPGYTQSRSYDTLHTHVGQALERDINGSSFNHAKLAYAKGLEEAFPEQTNSSGQLVRGADGKAFRQLTNKYGEGITAHPSIAAEINKRSRTEVTNTALKRYDKVNAGIKYTKLGGGAFHAVTEAGNFVGQQLTSGRLFTETKATGTALRSFFSPKTMERENARFRSNGTLDKAQIAGLKVMPHEILADANVTLGGRLSKYTGIQALHDATFQREIPYMKLKMFEQKTRGLDPTNPTDIAKMRSEAKGINSLFGGINRDVEGINPDTFQRMQRFILATDFTESKIGTALRTINLADRSPAANLARQAVLGKVLLFAGLAAAGGALGGEYKGKNAKQIAENILGKMADPSFTVGDYKVALPSTHVSEFSRPFIPLFDSKNKTAADRLKGMQHYATGRLAAVPGAAFQLVTNKDYSGNRIYGKDYKFNGGEQIGAGKTAANIAGMFGPIPFSQASSTIQGKQNIPAAVANVAGLRVTNEKLYNQDATPVKVSFGDTSTTLTKDKAIAYNKAVADQKTNLDKQLQNTSDYKSASPDDQKAMMSKLQGYITDNQKRIAATQNNIPLDKPASAAVQAVNANKLPSNLAKGKGTSGTSTPISPTIDAHSQKVLKEYNTLSADQRKAKAYNETDYDYKVAQAKYDNDKANNKLTTAGAIKAQDALTKAKVGSSYSKDTRDLYGLSKGDIYNLITTDPNGNKIASDLKNYDKALYDAGLSSSLKFKYGFGSVATSGGKRTYSAGRAAKGSSPSEIASAWTNHSTASQKYEKSLRAIAQHAALKGMPKITTKSGSKRVATFKEPKSSGISTVKLGSRKTLAKKLYA